MQHPWWNGQTANHLIWATATVLLGLFCLLSLWIYGRYKTGLVYAENAGKQMQREHEAQTAAEREARLRRDS